MWLKGAPSFRGGLKCQKVLLLNRLRFEGAYAPVTYQPVRSDWMSAAVIVVRRHAVELLGNAKAFTEYRSRHRSIDQSETFSEEVGNLWRENTFL
jgi:hypothetical protein